MGNVKIVSCDQVVLVEGESRLIEDLPAKNITSGYC